MIDFPLTDKAIFAYTYIRIFLSLDYLGPDTKQSIFLKKMY